MAKIVVNSRFLTQEITGVQRHAIEVSRRLKRLDPTIRFLSPPNIIHHDICRELGAQIVGMRTGHLWEQTELPRAASGKLLLGFCNNGPWFYRNQIVTIHDAAPIRIPHAYSFRFRALFRIASYLVGKSARFVMTDSEFSARDLARYALIPVEKLKVVRCGHQHVFNTAADAAIIARHGLAERPFLLAVGSASPHKNFARLMEALARIDNAQFDVVIAGGASPRVHQGRACDFGAGMRHVGYVSDAELRALYEHAAAFVHPSLFEGFGLPPLEAMALGCPVISSNAASLPEVCGDAAVYFDPANLDEMQAAIEEVMSNDMLREEMRSKGFRQAAKFDWDRCANEIMRLSADAPIT